MRLDSDRFPAPVYARTVLAVNFEDAKRYFLDSLLNIHYAHGVMLFEQGLLSREEAKLIFGALDSLKLDRIRAATYDGSHEDLFFYIEEMLASDIGVDTAGKLHTARSRNDIAITLYRMELRERVLGLAGLLLDLVRVLAEVAASHVHSIMPAHTHTQPAQPTTLAHYLCAVCEMLLRDCQRLQSAFATVNQNPLGSCAITTTGFPIDRQTTTRLLGFNALAVNSYGAIAGVDYVLQSAAAVSITMVNCGKFLHDLLLWSLREFGYLRLSDAFVQTSSIMPQKRNPVALEHARILASRSYGEAQAVMTTAHNTPFGDINDSEDDLFPLVSLCFEDAERAVELLSGVLQHATFDTDTMARRASESFITVTELADTLVRNEGISFREAHAIVAAAVKSSSDLHADIVSAVLAAGTFRSTRDDLLLALDAREFVRRRTVTGGPAPEAVQRQLESLADDREEMELWHSTAINSIVESKVSLAQARDAI
ncbi:MAG TPA: argininosuccinate lyase [Bryobacteraceae bacterium]|nr:argininosuccinate lyase [Bryobacteraceae bacterium]